MKTRVYAFGSGSNGRLGLGSSKIGVLFDDKDRHVPTCIPHVHNVKKISVGNHHSLILNKRGKVWSFGSNGYGQLGLGDSPDRDVPTLIPNLPKMKDISAGCSHTLLLSEGGQVWSFGSNVNGQLGLHDDEDRNTPTLVQDLPKIKKISAGYNYSLFLDEDGNVWPCGINKYGGPQDNRSQYIPNLPKIKDVSSGGYHSLLLSEDGNVWAFGSNVWGQLGLGSIECTNTPMCLNLTSRIKEISAGSDHSLILVEGEGDQDGQVYSFGMGSNGRLGLGDTENRNIPTRIPLPQGIKIQKISTKFYHSLILDEDGQVWAFGWNLHGMLGLGDFSDRKRPTLLPKFSNVIDISVGHTHSLILTSD